jgi:hypothetical protein
MAGSTPRDPDTMEMMPAAMSVIWGGVSERHPRLRIGFLESGGG